MPDLHSHDPELLLGLYSKLLRYLINKHYDGHLKIIEDDIISPPYALGLRIHEKSLEMVVIPEEAMHTTLPQLNIIQ